MEGVIPLSEGAAPEADGAAGPDLIPVLEAGVLVAVPLQHVIVVRLPQPFVGPWAAGDGLAGALPGALLTYLAVLDDTSWCRGAGG